MTSGHRRLRHLSINLEYLSVFFSLSLSSLFLNLANLKPKHAASCQSHSPLFLLFPLLRKPFFTFPPIPPRRWPGVKKVLHRSGAKKQKKVVNIPFFTTHTRHSPSYASPSLSLSLSISSFLLLLVCSLRMPPARTFLSSVP